MFNNNCDFCGSPNKVGRIGVDGKIICNCGAICEWDDELGWTWYATRAYQDKRVDGLIDKSPSLANIWYDTTGKRVSEKQIKYIKNLLS